MSNLNTGMTTGSLVHNINERFGIPARLLLAWAALWSITPLGWVSAGEPDLASVDPLSITQGPGRVGQVVVIDDRIRVPGGFEFHKGLGFNEIRLKRSPIVLRLPANLSFERPPKAAGVRAIGTLSREGGEFACDVTSLEILPDDLTRVEQGAGELAPGNTEGRMAWSRWADLRGKAFNDPKLSAKARSLEAEAIQIESDRPSPEGPARWVRLAHRGREHGVPEPEPSAQAHRGFRGLLGEAKTSADADRIVPDIEAFFPAARPPAKSAPPDLAARIKSYDKDPAETYRRATPEVRAALDRRLLADAIEKALRLRAEAHPLEALDLSRQAQARLPDRPEVATDLRDRGLDAAAKNVGSLRQFEVLDLAKSFENLGQKGRAQDLKRDWLDDQRKNRLGPTDAEGRVLLARQYEDWMNDVPTSVSLLKDALRIDPESREADDALRRLDYRKIDEEWVGPEAPRPKSQPSDGEQLDATLDPERGNSLRGLTREEVRAKLGEPPRVVRTATLGLVVEQWIFSGAKGTQYINFAQRPGQSEATVEAQYSLP